MSVPRRSATLGTALFLALAAAPAAPASAGAQDSPARLVQDSLTFHKDADSPGIRATLSVHVPEKKGEGESCVDVLKVGVAVRNARQETFDYHPSINEKTTICPGANKVFTTEPKTFPGFPQETYTAFGYYQGLDGVYKPLDAVLAVTPQPDFKTGRKHVFDEDFNDSEISRKRWNNSMSGSYNWDEELPEKDRGVTNLKDNKLDRITPRQVSLTKEKGWATFTADRAPDAPLTVTPKTLTELKKPEKNCKWQKDDRPLEVGDKVTAWRTGLLTTQGTSEKDFLVEPGDYVETRVRLPKQTGAWPALWTWGAGTEEDSWHSWAGEVDSFEYHPGPEGGAGHPNLLELTNRVLKPNPTAHYTDTRDIAPGKEVTIGTYYGKDSVDWYINGNKVFSDHKGVPEGWKAYLILNLSVSGNCYGRQPTDKDKDEPITFAADYVHVYR